MDKEKPRRQRSVSYVPFGDRKFSINELAEFLPPVLGGLSNEEFQALDTQVAGHQFNEEKGTIGLLKCKDGTILKPVTKPEQGLREIRLYEQMQSTTDPSIIELKQYSSVFSGTRMLEIQGKKVEFIILDNVSDGMAEPCIIDIKIGKITWDPNASPEKIAKEEEKYAKCKNDVGFCIPGFQVYKLATDRLHKYNKEYGKKLNGVTVIEALKVFLNGDGNKILCRELIVNLLSELWKIQKWAKIQRSLRLYATSLLIVYDCKKLKSIIEQKISENTTFVMPPLYRTVSFNASEGVKAGPSVQLNAAPNPVSPQPTTSYQKFTTLNSCYSVVENRPHWEKDFRKITRSHSFHHNYNDYLSRVKKDYASTLQELIDDKPKKNKQWFNVKIVDYAHTFPADDDSPDTNYIDGIDKLVKIFENFLTYAK